MNDTSQSTDSRQLAVSPNASPSVGLESAPKSVVTVDVTPAGLTVVVPRSEGTFPVSIDVLNARWRRLDSTRLDGVSVWSDPTRAYSVARLRAEVLMHVVFRGTSVLAELRGLASLRLQEALEIAYWNDAVAVWKSSSARSWCVMANRSCSIPLFWSTIADRVIFADSVLSKAGVMPSSVDEVGLAEALIFDVPLRQRTIWAGIHQVPGGYSVDVNATTEKLTRRCELQIGGGLTGARLELVEAAAELLEAAVHRSIDRTDGLLIPLSGGLDSRGILGCIPNGTARVRAVGYGHYASLELIYSRSAAKCRAVPWSAYHLNAAHFRRSFPSLLQRSGVMSHRMHCHTAAAVKNATNDGQWLAMTGFMGDPVQGSRAGVATQTTSENECIDYILQKYRQTRESFERMFPEPTRAGIVEDLRWLFRDMTVRHEPRQFDEFFFVTERQPKLITHIFNSFMEPSIRLAFPYMDGQWARFFLGLSQTHRVGRSVFIDSLKVLDPSLWSIPSLGGGEISARPKRRLIHESLEKVRFLQNTVESVTFGFLSTPDPCQTENVRHILRTVLSDRVRAVAHTLGAQGVLPKPVVAEVQSLSYRHLDAFAGYRLISLSDFLNASDLCGA